MTENAVVYLSGSRSGACDRVNRNPTVRTCTTVMYNCCLFGMNTRIRQTSSTRFGALRAGREPLPARPAKSCSRVHLHTTYCSSTTRATARRPFRQFRHGRRPRPSCRGHREAWADRAPLHPARDLQSKASRLVKMCTAQSAVSSLPCTPLPKMEVFNRSRLGKDARLRTARLRGVHSSAFTARLRPTHPQPTL